MDIASPLPKAFVLESTGTVHEIMHGVFPFVQINTLESEWQQYEGRVYLRNILKPIKFDFRDLLGKPYEQDVIELLRSPLQMNYKLKENPQSIFCSQLAALIYKRCGVFNRHIIPTNIIPEQLQVQRMDAFDLLYESHELTEQRIK